MPNLIPVIHHKTGRTIHVPPVQVAGLEAAGWFDTDSPVIEVTEPDQPTGAMPSTAAELIDWIGTNHERAAQALETETGRDKPRSTVIDHITTVTESEEDPS